MKENGNPLQNPGDDDGHLQLIREALSGQRKSLNRLLEIHNLFIFNIAVKMLGDIEKAKDVTQDILIKITTNLSKYDSEKGQFHSWIYRTAFNHILDFEKSAAEKRIRSFGQLFDFIDDIESQDRPDYEEEFDITQEVKIKCTTGMLMCLSREQRLLFIVGELFQIDHKLGAEIFNISRDNFRKKLSRIRSELYQWMHDRCGLVNKSNPCRCAKKTKGFIKAGIVDPDNLVWNKDIKTKIEAYTSENIEELQLSSDSIYRKLYEEHPMKKPESADSVLSTVLGDERLREILEI